MAILKRNNGTYQARFLDANRRVVSRVFATRREAEEQEARWKQQKADGLLGAQGGRTLTMNEYFLQWHKDAVDATPEHRQSGWRRVQAQLYRDYVGPEIGQAKLKDISPQMVRRVLIVMAKKGMSEQTQLHVFGFMRKLFGDAIENYQYLIFNPAIRKLKPKVAVKEAKHLNLDQIRRLLTQVADRKYGLAIWLQLYMGLRAGELQALKWEDIDLETGRITIRRVYVRKMDLIRDYPKGRKQHSASLPIEVLEMLREAKAKATSDLVVTSPRGNLLPYRWYLKALRDYCRELDIPVLGTHGLRHSTSELYMSHGASRDDLRQLFAHSSTTVTDRYVHDRGSNLEKVANVIQLFEKRVTTPVTTGEKSGNLSTENQAGVTTKLPRQGFSDGAASEGVS